MRSYNPITGQSSAIIASQILETEFVKDNHNNNRTRYFHNIDRRVFNHNFNRNKFVK